MVLLPAPLAPTTVSAPVGSGATVSGEANATLIFANEDESREEVRAAKYESAVHKLGTVSSLAESIAARLASLTGAARLQ